LKRVFILSLSATVLLGTASIGAAATVTNVSARAVCGGIYANTDSGTGPVQVTQAANTQDCVSFASARAGGGFVGVSAATQGQVDGETGGGSSSAVAGALATFDIFFVTPASYTSGLINVSANFFYTGLMNAGPHTLDTGNLTATASYNGFFELRGNVSNLTIASDKINFGETERKTVQNGTDGPAVILEPSVVAVTNYLMIDPTYGARVTMNLQAFAETAYDATALSSATANFYNSLSFAKSGPVFNLPEGFSAFSTDGSIVDNVWIDPRIPVGPAPVPLPASFLLLLTGGLAVRFAGKRRT